MTSPAVIFVAVKHFILRTVTGPDGLETNSITIYERENFAGQAQYIPTHDLRAFDRKEWFITLTNWDNFGRYLTSFNNLHYHGKMVSFFDL